MSAKIIPMKFKSNKYQKYTVQSPARVLPISEDIKSRAIASIQLDMIDNPLFHDAADLMTPFEYDQIMRKVYLCNIDMETFWTCCSKILQYNIDAFSKFDEWFHEFLYNTYQ